MAMESGEALTGLSPGWSRLYTLLARFSALVVSPDSPNTWNEAFEAMAGLDPFFSRATISAYCFDFEEGARELLVSYGPQAHRLTLTKSGLSLAALGGPGAVALSRLRQGEPLVISGVQHLPVDVADLVAWLLSSVPAKPLIILPLLGYGRLLGAFLVEDYSPAGCTTERMELLRLLSNCLSQALAASIRDREVGERDLALAAALAAQEKEKERIALDVHDGALQMLASAFQHVQAARDFRRQDEKARSDLMKASSLLKEAMHELRGLMDSLRPATLDRFGLLAAIESDVQELRQGGWEVDLVADSIQLPKDMETALYRVVHEALTNIKKHAGICRVRVLLEKRGSEFGVEVRDWGQGFEPAGLAHLDALPGFGLLSMRKRTELLGGRFEVHSGRGAGTRVSLQVPAGRKGDGPPWIP